MKFGLVGFGLAGKAFHAPLIHAIENASLSYIVSSRESEIKELYPQVEVMSSFDELLEKDVDIIVLATPNHTHFPYAKLALLKNKHVIIDKPFTPTLEEAKELIELAKTQKCKISAFHNRRLDGDFLTIQKLIQNRELGEVKLFQSNFNRMRSTVDKNNWRETTDVAGGVFYDLGPHLIDQALCLFGYPSEVILDKRNMREDAVNDDYFHVQLMYADKVIELNAHCFKSAPMLRFEVMGDKGSFQKYFLDPQESELKDNKPVDKIGADKMENYGTLYLNGEEKIIKTEKGCYIKYYENFIKAVEEKSELLVRPQEVLALQYAIDLLLKSYDEKKVLKWEMK
jgi:scyllo-inositol 2-dehydrogenase (NADP+)